MQRVCCCAPRRHDPCIAAPALGPCPPQIAEGCVKVFVTQTDALTALCLQARRRGDGAVPRLSAAAGGAAAAGCAGRARAVAGCAGRARAAAAACAHTQHPAAGPWLRLPLVSRIPCPPPACLCPAGRGRRAPQGALGLVPGAGPAVHRPGPGAAGARGGAGRGGQQQKGAAGAAEADAALACSHRRPSPPLLAALLPSQTLPLLTPAPPPPPAAAAPAAPCRRNSTPRCCPR